MGHVVTQIVETEFGVRGVGDVAKISLAFLLGGFAREVDADREAEEAIDVAHPFRVTGGEVFVHGDDVDAAPSKCVEIDGHRRGQGFTFAGPHLSDVAAVEDERADDLDFVRELVKGTLGTFAADRESTMLDFFEAFVLDFLVFRRGEVFLEFLRLGAKFIVGLGSHFFLERDDLVRFLHVAVQFFFLKLEDGFKYVSHCNLLIEKP